MFNFGVLCKLIIIRDRKFESRTARMFLFRMDWKGSMPILYILVYYCTIHKNNEWSKQDVSTFSQNMVLVVLGVYQSICAVF